MKPLFTLREVMSAAEAVAVSSVPPELQLNAVVTDSRKDCRGALFLALKGDAFDGHDFLEAAVASGAGAICVNRDVIPADRLAKLGVPVIAVPDTVQAYQDLANYHKHRFPALKTVALTGSSGKTSTKEMLRAICVAAYGPDAVLATEGNTNNQIGVPQNLLRLTDRHQVCILEMGTNHHGEIEPLSRTAEPDVAVITFIGRCHLEFLGSLEGVAYEKSRIFSALSGKGTAVIPFAGSANHILEQAAAPFRVFKFGENERADVRSHYLGGKLSGSRFRLEFHRPHVHYDIDWSLSGRHQAINASAAAAAALALEIDPDIIARGLADCKLPGMRMRVTDHGGATWINDAYNANPDSMASSLRWLSEFADPAKLMIVLGDMRELGDCSRTEQLKAVTLARKLFPHALLAAVGPEMNALAHDANVPVGVNFFPDAETAAAALRPRVTPGMTVFLKASRGIKLETVEPQA